MNIEQELQRIASELVELANQCDVDGHTEQADAITNLASQAMHLRLSRQQGVALGGMNAEDMHPEWQQRYQQQVKDDEPQDFPVLNGLLTQMGYPPNR